MKGAKSKGAAKADAKLAVKSKGAEKPVKGRKGKAGKDPNKPKRAPSAFFVFMEEFRKEFKEKNPKNKSVAAASSPTNQPTLLLYDPLIVGKAAGDRWKSLTKSLMDLPGPRWKKGKDGKDFAALAAANPMSSIVADLQASLRDSGSVVILAAHTRDVILEVGTSQAKLLNCAAFGRAMESAGAAERQWFQLGLEEAFFLCHALKCVAVESENKVRLGAAELWDLLASTSEQFPEMYRAYEHLRLKNWVVKSGLQYGADFVAYRHHPALVHSEFAVKVVPEGEAFDTRCGRMKNWPELLCALRASGSVAKTLLVLSISTKSSELGSLDCLEQMIVHERTITRWIPQQCREKQDKPSREETSRDGQRQKSCREESSNEEQECSGGVVFTYWGVMLSFTILCSFLVCKLKS